MNLTNTASGLIVANAITEGLANASLYQFLTGMKDGKQKAGVDGGLVFTIPGLMTGEDWPSYKNTSKSMADVLKMNFKQNAFPMIATAVAAPIAIRVSRKFLAKGLINPLNRGLRAVGIDGVKF